MNSFYSAVRSGDARRVLSYVPIAEQKAAALDEAKARRLLLWSNEYLKGFHSAEVPRIELSERKKTGIAEWTLENKDGQKSTLYFSCYIDEQNQPKCFLTTAVITGAIDAHYGSLFSDTPRNERAFRVLSEGMRHEGSVLDSLGLKGMVSADAEAKLRSWKHWERFAAKSAERIKVATSE